MDFLNLTNWTGVAVVLAAGLYAVFFATGMNNAKTLELKVPKGKIFQAFNRYRFRRLMATMMLFIVVCLGSMFIEPSAGKWWVLGVSCGFGLAGCYALHKSCAYILRNHPEISKEMPTYTAHR